MDYLKHDWCKNNYFSGYIFKFNSKIRSCGVAFLWSELFNIYFEFIEKKDLDGRIMAIKFKEIVMMAPDSPYIDLFFEGFELIINEYKSYEMIITEKFTFKHISNNTNYSGKLIW